MFQENIVKLKILLISKETAVFRRFYVITIFALIHFIEEINQYV